jgi:hypothetical protein
MKKKKKKFIEKTGLSLPLHSPLPFRKVSFPLKKNRMYNAESSVAEIGIFIKIPPQAQNVASVPVSGFA